MDAVPDGEWFCVECSNDPGAGVGVFKALSVALPSKAKGKVGKRGSPGKKDVEDEGNVQENDGVGGKRKAPPKGKTGGMYLFVFVFFFLGGRLMLFWLSAAKKKKQ